MAQELACVYAAIILADDGLAITADKISAILQSAGVEVPNFWVKYFADFFASHDIKDFLTASSGSGAVQVVEGDAPAAAGDAAEDAPAEEEPEESESESDFGFGGLF